LGIQDQRDYNPESNYIGYLGEWVFNEFLETCNLKDKVKWSRDANGEADKGDFFFGGKIIDIKTASKSFHIKLMMPCDQFLKNHRDFYVAIKILDGVGEIKGYATRDDLKKVTPANFGFDPSLAINHTRLKPIKELIEQEILKKWEKKNE